MGELRERITEIRNEMATAEAPTSADVLGREIGTIWQALDLIVERIEG